MSADIEELIRRLEAGAGLDRLLDADIRIASPRTGESDLRRAVNGLGYVTGNYHDVKRGYREVTGTFAAPKYTGSLDDAAGLYMTRPALIPSQPRLIAADALRLRLGMERGI